MLTGMDYYSEGIQIKISKRKRSRSPSQHSPMGMHFILLVTVYDSARQLLPTREAHPSHSALSHIGRQCPGQLLLLSLHCPLEVKLIPHGRHLGHSKSLYQAGYFKRPEVKSWSRTNPSTTGLSLECAWFKETEPAKLTLYCAE